MKYATAIIAAALAGLATGLVAPRILAPRQSFEECLIDKMKGQPPLMFFTVEVVCSVRPGREMTDAEVGLSPPKDDWRSVTRK